MKRVSNISWTSGTTRFEGGEMSKLGFEIAFAIRQRAFRPYRYDLVHRLFQDRQFNLLDVGCGNHSARLAKYWFPNCHYFGLDKDKNYNNDAGDFLLMDDFYEIDLTSLDYQAIPDDKFDIVILSQVIEHLTNGDQVVQELLGKIRPGGYVYIEYPGILSTKKRALVWNFYKDSSHCRIYSLPEICSILEHNGMRILHKGIPRDIREIIAFPVAAVLSLILIGYVTASTVSSVYGLYEYVLACRNATKQHR
jgi:SAM-dependent methyltransferase